MSFYFLNFFGFKLTFGEQFQAQSSICNSRAMRWWEKALKPNIIDINSSQELVDSLLIAGDKLVIVDFYSPGCGGCITLNPKVIFKIILKNIYLQRDPTHFNL